jgi:hypothetical protein
MVEQSQPTDLPELIFGIAGPVGVDIVAICDSVANALRNVGYEAHLIHLTKEMMQYELRTHNVPPPADSNFFSDVLFKIDYANALCAEAEDPLRSLGSLYEQSLTSEWSLQKHMRSCHQTRPHT